MNFKLEQKEINSEIIKIPSDNFCFLGPELYLKDCELVNQAAAKNLSFCGFDMKGGKFNTKKKLSDFQMKNCNFSDVQFEGVYSGCDFGIESSIQNCSFKNSTLDNCRFIDTDLSNIVFPEKHHIVLLKDDIHRAAENKDSLGPKLGIFVGVLNSPTPGPLSAVVLNINLLAKRLKISEAKIQVLGKQKCAYKRVN